MHCTIHKTSLIVLLKLHTVNSMWDNSIDSQYIDTLAHPATQVIKHERHRNLYGSHSGTNNNQHLATYGICCRLFSCVVDWTTKERVPDVAYSLDLASRPT